MLLNVVYKQLVFRVECDCPVECDCLVECSPGIRLLRTVTQHVNEQKSMSSTEKFIILISPGVVFPALNWIDWRESSSNDDRNGSINATQKVNSRCFKLHCSYCSSLNFSNVGDFSRVES